MKISEMTDGQLTDWLYNKNLDRTGDPDLVFWRIYFKTEDEDKYNVGDLNV
jgi:hypothetical protein